MSGKKDEKLKEECDDDEEEEEDKKCPPNRHVSRWNLNEGRKKGGASLFYSNEMVDAKCPPQQVPWSEENEEKEDHKPGKHRTHRDSHDKLARKHHKHEHKMNEGRKKGGASLFYNNEMEGAKCPPQQVPWSKENEEREDHKPGKHRKHRDSHDKHANKHHKHEHKMNEGHKKGGASLFYNNEMEDAKCPPQQVPSSKENENEERDDHKPEHMKQPSMESSNHQQAHREFAQKDEETITMGEGVFCSEWEKFNEATGGHVPGSDPNEREVSNEARQAAFGSSGGQHAVSLSRDPGTDASPGAEGVDGRAHPSNNAQRRTHAFPPTRPGAVRVPGPDNEGIDEDDEQMTVESRVELTIPFVPEAERVNTEDEERRHQAAVNQAMDDFIATAPVADVVPDNRGRRWKLVGAVLLLVIFVAIIMYIMGYFHVVGATPPPGNETFLSLLQNVSSDGGKALQNHSTPQYKAFNWMVTNNTHLAASSEEQIIQRYALATLFYSTNGSSWNDTQGWLSEEKECLWYGLECTNGTTSSAVSDLFLDDNSLQGTLPPEIGLLSELASLVLSWNELSGMIPTEIGMLSDSLAWLDLSDNTLNDTIPSEINSLVNLVGLYLYGNNLTGTYTCPESINDCLISCDDLLTDTCRSL